MAAAAAHELGTPLATIQTTARELERQLDGEQKEDAGVIVDQARRCRKILGRLSDRGDAGDVVHDQMPLSSVLEEASEPFLGAADVRIELHGAGELAGPPPDLKRTPEILYALKNLVENACGFAESTVVVEAVWDGERVEIRIMDDGPGYPPEVLARLGEPYVGGWMRRDTNGRDHQGGLGLGLFIAKTMVERTGGTISFGRAPREKGLTGAMASVTWPRSTVEARGLRGRQPTKTGFPDDRDASNDTTPAYTG
jgi:two-component system sensor histidine kinase RegB